MNMIGAPKYTVNKASPNSTSQKSSRVLEASQGWKVLQLILE
jgi:hypothetical protein